MKPNKIWNKILCPLLEFCVYTVIVMLVIYGIVMIDYIVTYKL